MLGIFAFLLDLALFVGAPFILWGLLRQCIPAAVIPILLGMMLAIIGLPLRDLGLPSWTGNQVGWIGVLLLAFTAGMETRHPLKGDGKLPVFPADPLALARLAASAGFALLLPFAVGTAVAYRCLLALPGWIPERGTGALAAIAIGLCIAVSALPVLIGIVRELSPRHRPLGQIALTVAVVDDAALWVGLALLQIAAVGSGTESVWTLTDNAAALVLPALLLVGQHASTRFPFPSLPLVWTAMILWLGAGVWASSHLGLHELIGAYFAGVALPAAWMRRLPVERIGFVALLVFAPLFFGHSGLKVVASAFNGVTIIAAGGLLLLCVVTKVGAILLIPPRDDLSRREALAIGSLLQCKGLMEIVAAAILSDKGLVSPAAFATLVTLAILSTTLTGPLFRTMVCEPDRLSGIGLLRQKEET